ncbi:hypothetical protein A9Q84_00020 [Halobacteriovorax marinus]|mgnify:CR=1 FL=1|uniref:Peptidase S1 domain-containing protein n=1 Tax=Halobacteriovorax marinus TaxID=97084 RepID=A0A1Y5FIQ8_9BACT|nr:hypothetical protein A9Q84_00020 [Halobacteriovorax marinus]
MKSVFKILLLASLVIATVQAELHPSDDRKVKGPDSPKFLDAVGRLTVKKSTGATNYCGATLVGFTADRKSRIVVTSAHCLKADNISWKTTTKSGKVIKRKIVKVLEHETLSDYAILLLDDYVEPSDVAPLIIDYEGGDSVGRMITRGGKAVIAGYSADKELGQGGKVLTYDDSIESIGSCNDEVKCPVGGSTRGGTTYSGASGGATIVTFESPYASVNKGVQHYFVGPIKGGLTSHFESSNGIRGSNNTLFTFHERFWSPLFDHMVEYNGAVEGIE